MSDVSQGPGWWLASDGRWYPPESASTLPHPPPPPPMVPAKRPLLRRPWFWVTTGLLVIVIAVAAGIAAWRTRQEHQQHVITYSVTGATDRGGVIVIYTTARGGSASENVDLPWSKTVIVSGPLKGFGVSALTDVSGDYVTCTISEDGTLISQDTAHGNNLTPRGQANCNLPVS